MNEIKYSLQEKNNVIMRLIDDMNYRVNKIWTQKERFYVDACFAYKHYKAELLIKPDRKDTIVRIEENTKRYIRTLLGENYEKTLDEMMEVVYLQAYTSLQEIKDFKKKLRSTMEPYGYHVSPISGLYELKASIKKENMYCNEVLDGVFAVTSYDQLILYMGRAVAGGMHVLQNGGICIYSKNPVEIIKKEKVVLKKDVNLYRVSLGEFEPVIDYILNDGRAEILFDHEWISRKDKVACNGITLSTIPLEDWIKHIFFYNTGAVDETILGEIYSQKMSKDCLNKVLIMLVENGKLVHILGDERI